MASSITSTPLSPGNESTFSGSTLETNMTPTVYDTQSLASAHHHTHLIKQVSSSDVSSLPNFYHTPVSSAAATANGDDNDDTSISSKSSILSKYSLSSGAASNNNKYSVASSIRRRDVIKVSFSLFGY